MPRDFEIYLEDIRYAILKIQSYTTGLTRDSFALETKTIDAVVRNLEIIGEAAKMIPESLRVNYPNIEWRKIAGLRDISPIITSKLIWTSSGTLFKTSYQHWHRN